MSTLDVKLIRKGLPYDPPEDIVLGTATISAHAPRTPQVRKVLKDTHFSSPMGRYDLKYMHQIQGAETISAITLVIETG